MTMLVFCPQRHDVMMSLSCHQAVDREVAYILDRVGLEKARNRRLTVCVFFDWNWFLMKRFASISQKICLLVWRSLFLFVCVFFCEHFVCVFFFCAFFSRKACRFKLLTLQQPTQVIATRSLSEFGPKIWIFLVRTTKDYFLL